MRHGLCKNEFRDSTEVTFVFVDIDGTYALTLHSLPTKDTLAGTTIPEEPEPYLPSKTPSTI